MELDEDTKSTIASALYWAGIIGFNLLTWVKDFFGYVVSGSMYDDLVWLIEFIAIDLSMELALIIVTGLMAVTGFILSIHWGVEPWGNSKSSQKET